MSTAATKKHELFVRLSANRSHLNFSEAASVHLGSSADIYYHDHVVAVVSTPVGRFRLGATGKTKSNRQISCKELAVWVESQFNTRASERIPAWYDKIGLDQVLFFGYPQDRAEALQAFSKDIYKKLELNYGRLRYLYILDSCNWSYYVSSGAAARLGDRVSVYTSGDYLALRPDSMGAIPVSGNHPSQRHSFSSESLKRLLRGRFQGVSKLWFVPCGEMMVITDSSIPPRHQDLPAPDDFHLVEVKHHSCNGMWAALEVDRVRISKAAAENLAEKVSVYETGDTVVLLNDDDDVHTLKVYHGKMKMLLSRGLVRVLKNKFSVQPGGDIHAAKIPNGVVLFDGRVRGAAVVDPTRMVKLNERIRQQARELGISIYQHRIRFTVSASVLLQQTERVSVYISPIAMAVRFVPDPTGPFQLRLNNVDRAKYIGSTELSKCMAKILKCSSNRAVVCTVDGPALLVQSPERRAVDQAGWMEFRPHRHKVGTEQREEGDHNAPSTEKDRPFARLHPSHLARTGL